MSIALFTLRHATGNADVAREISKRGHHQDVAVKVYHEELQRQKELGETIRQFNRQTRNKLESFIQFDWLNAPFQPWDKP